MSDLVSAPNRNLTLCVWEGEWPLLKQTVHECRSLLVKSATMVADLFDARGYIELARTTAQESDRLIVDSSKVIARSLRGNEWIVPAGGFSSLGLFVFSKSLRWGVFSASRNATVATSMALCLAYPHELRQLVLNNVPF